jgi:hypothetical protein
VDARGAGRQRRWRRIAMFTSIAVVLVLAGVTLFIN